MLEGTGVSCIPKELHSQFLLFLDSLYNSRLYYDHPRVEVSYFNITDNYINLLHIRVSNNVHPIAKSRLLPMSDYKRWLRGVLIDML